MAGLLQFSDAWVSVFPCSLVTSFSWHLSFWGLSANAETHRMKMSNSLRILYFIFHEVRKLQCLFHFMLLPPAHLYTVRESSLSFIMWQNLTQGIWNRSFILSGQTAQSQTPLWSPHGQMGGQPLVLWTDANFREKTKTNKNNFTSLRQLPANPHRLFANGSFSNTTADGIKPSTCGPSGAVNSQTKWLNF